MTRGRRLKMWLYENFTLNKPILTIGNVTNVKEDWGVTWTSNFSANVTHANASGVCMNFSNFELFTNASLVYIGTDMWVNETHNIPSPVTNISVTITLNSTTPDAANGTATFWVNITKRDLDSTMDSPGTQSVDVGEKFWINATVAR